MVVASNKSRSKCLRHTATKISDLFLQMFVTFWVGYQLACIANHIPVSIQFCERMIDITAHVGPSVEMILKHCLVEDCIWMN